MRFLLGTSVFDGGKAKGRGFAEAWVSNLQLLDERPSRTVMILEGGSFEPGVFDGDLIHLTGDLGHVHDHLEGRKSYEFTGWSASMLALAMTAYVDCADFLYKESDCIAWGPWVKQMYADLGDGKIIFGPKMIAEPWMACAQSLFLVRHDWIPTFVQFYLSLGKDGQIGNLGEDKFKKMKQRFPRECRELSFGVDRMRPIPWDDEVGYFQQPTDAELAEARRRNLI